MSVTTIDLDSELVAAAKSATGQTTIRGAVVAALELVVQQQSQREALQSLFSSVSLADWLDPAVRAKAEG